MTNHKIFQPPTLGTSNDLWPTWRTKGIIYWQWSTHTLSLKFQQLTWNNRYHLLSMEYLHTNFEVQEVSILGISCLQSKTSHTRTHIYTLTITQIPYLPSARNQTVGRQVSSQHTQFAHPLKHLLKQCITLHEVRRMHNQSAPLWVKHEKLRQFRAFLKGFNTREWPEEIG